MGGYNVIIDKMLDGVEVELGTDYLANKDKYENIADKIIFTGPIDEFYDYCFGPLGVQKCQIRDRGASCRKLSGNAVINYTDAETPYTRIIEHKHFEFGTQPTTVISKEYSAEWKVGDEPYYPVNNDKKMQHFIRNIWISRKKKIK